ncbi:MAG: hypothetical protein ABL927_12820 [Bdellovibrionales bacterium]
MDKIKVRIIKNRSINLKVNSEIFEQIKNAAIRNKHFVSDYINLILFEQLKSIESSVKLDASKKT